jgi:catechol-2,3-dioxygenase
LQVDSVETVDAWHAWLKLKGVEVLGPVDHKIIYSIYFHDPNGVRLEITTPTAPVWNDNAAAARSSLDDWNALKQRAADEGIELTKIVAEFTAERSHRRASQTN